VSESDLFIKVSLLEKDMQLFQQSLYKFEEQTEKQQQQYITISDKINSRMEKLREEFQEDIHELQLKIDSQIEDQNEMLDLIRKKLESFDRWRWIMIGSVAVVVFIIQRIIINLHLTT
jgi:ribosome-binding ATPase YchF (GTP1/OBG family)